MMMMMMMGYAAMNSVRRPSRLAMASLLLLLALVLGSERGGVSCEVINTPAADAAAAAEPATVEQEAVANCAADGARSADGECTANFDQASEMESNSTPDGTNEHQRGEGRDEDDEDDGSEDDQENEHEDGADFLEKVDKFNDISTPYRLLPPKGENGAKYYLPIPNGGSIQWAQGPYRQDVLRIVEESKNYLAARDHDPTCVNDNMFCSTYASLGDCPQEIDRGVLDDEEFMIYACRLACKLCDYAVGETGEEAHDDEDEDDDDEEDSTIHEQQGAADVTEDAYEGNQNEHEEEYGDSETAEEDDEEAEDYEDEDDPDDHDIDDHDDDEEDDGDDDDDDDEDDDEYEDEYVEDVGEGKHAATPWGVDQFIVTDIQSDVFRIITNTELYMNGMLEREDYEKEKNYFDHLHTICRNKDPLCSYWAATGGCEPGDDVEKDDEDEFYEMIAAKCGPACQACEDMSYDERCVGYNNTAGVWDEPGSVDAFFDRITTDPYFQEQFGPMDIIGNPREDYDMPWIVTFDNFITDEECDRLIELGGVEGYEQSLEVSDEDEEEEEEEEEDEPDRRTSTNSWCLTDCYKDPTAQRIHERIDNFTHIPRQNSEYLQLLRYLPGQLYMEHHDYITGEAHRMHGPRILTVFMYLNDVKEGGGTKFSHLNITVQPKKGRVLIWPSVLNDYPFILDLRTSHEALAVERGIKYGANAWFHQRDYKSSMARDCT